MPLYANPVPAPTPPDLVTPARAQQNAMLATLYASNPAQFASLVAASSSLIRRYCHRDFTVQAYTEYYSGVPNQSVLRLRQFPVLRVASVGVATAAFQVLNGGSVYQEATIETTATAMILTGFVGPTPTVTTLLYSAYPTLNALATAIGALGNGWTTATMSGSCGSFGPYASNRFKRTQGASTARIGGTFLEIYEAWYPGASWAGDGDWGAWTGTAGWRLDAETGELMGRWPRGHLNIEVVYSAGFSEVPGVVQEAVVQMSTFLLASGKLNWAVQSQRIGEAAVTFRAQLPGMPAAVKMMLSPFIDHSKIISR